MLRRKRFERAAPRLLRGSAWPLCLVLLAGSGCSDPLSVTNPDAAQPADLDSPAGLAALRAGAFGDFAKAYGGDATASDAQEAQILATGMFTDEFKNTETDPERIAYDARRIDPQGTGQHLGNFYAVLHRARAAAEATALAYRQAAPSNADEVIAEMMSLAGFTYTFFAEDYCSGVPVSSLSASGDIQYGLPRTTQELLQLSAERFDTAIAHAQQAGGATLEQLARVGKGRALVNLGQFTQAGTVVAPVPTTFRYEIKYSTNTPRQENAVFYAVNSLRRWSLVNRKGGTGIDFLDAFTQGDPRTPWVLGGPGFDKTTGNVSLQLLYPTLAAPIPLATGVEARLIEAEAALSTGDSVEFQNIHNALRASLNAPAVGPISVDTMSAAQRVDFHFRERAMWLFLTGHRLGDMRRLVRQYGRTQEQVFPSGPYYRPQYPTFGTDVNFPVAFAETNNPNFTGCSDRNP